MKNILAIIISGLWIAFSEFLRNELLFKDYWIRHYNSMGLKLETLPVNGIIWVLWSFGLAYLIFRLTQKFSYKDTIILSWIPAFLMMWLVTYNLQVLPQILLLYAVPLSIVEVLVASIITRKMLWQAT